MLEKNISYYLFRSIYPSLLIVCFLNILIIFTSSLDIPFEIIARDWLLIYLEAWRDLSTSFDCCLKDPYASLILIFSRSTISFSAVLNFVSLKDEFENYKAVFWTLWKEFSSYFSIIISDCFGGSRFIKCRRLYYLNSYYSACRRLCRLFVCFRRISSSGWEATFIFEIS